MTSTTTSIRHRVAYLLHLAISELRSLALGKAPHPQIAELADAIENLPKYLAEEPTAEDWDMIRFVIENYNKQYPDSGWALVQALDSAPPDRY